MPDDSKLEEEIIASFERDEWRSVASARKEIDRYAGHAVSALAKDKRVNIRIASRDLEDLQARAAREGLPYQTLMSSVLHKYVTGRLVDAAPSSSTPRRPAVRKRGK